MPWLELLKFNGKEYISVLYDNPHQKIWKEWRDVRYIELSDTLATFALESLRVIYSEEAKAKAPTPPAEHKWAKHLDEIVGYIKTSHHAGERSNAKDLYFKITGTKYTGPEYQAP